MKADINGIPPVASKDGAVEEVVKDSYDSWLFGEDRGKSSTLRYEFVVFLLQLGRVQREQLLHLAAPSPGGRPPALHSGLRPRPEEPPAGRLARIPSR
jgi:hypothetical protein